MIINPHYQQELEYQLSQYSEQFFQSFGKSKEEVLDDKDSIERAAYIFQKNHEEYDCDYDWSMKDAIEEVFGIKIQESSNKPIAIDVKPTRDDKIKIFRKLRVSELGQIKSERLLYLTDSRFGQIRKPVMVLGITQQDEMEKSLRMVNLREDVPVVERRPLAKYPDIWFLEEEDGFIVQTPHGLLWANNKRDSEYPGVYVELVQPDGRNTTLAMVEYIPRGEGLCDYMPTNLSEMERQTREVPVVRCEHDDSGNPCVSEGFVTRAWPDEEHDEDFHMRTFHFGY